MGQHTLAGNIWLHRYAIILAVCTLFLVAAGASVTSKEAGLSVPDWPLSYGQVMPEMTGGVFYEHGHRMIATGVGMLTIGLLVFLYAAEDRRWLKRLGWIALALVIAQGVLGGLTVLYLLPKPVSIAHACTAQVFFSLTCAIALFTSPSWRRGAVIVEDQGWPSLRTLAVAAPVLILVQIALGAAFRHRALGLMPHVIGAILIGAAVMMISVFVLTQFPKHSSLRRAGLAVLVVTGVQILMGIAAYLARLNEASSHNWMIFSTVTHVALGGLTMGLTVLQMLEVLYHVRRPAELAATEAAAHSR